MSSSVVVVCTGAVATITIDRAEKRNAMTREMWSALADAASALTDDPEIRIVVVRGAGTHFCAGADIGEFADGRDEDYDKVNRRAEDALASFPGPTVAVIRGNCIGGGVSIATACDVRIAAADSIFGVTPAKLGLVYPSNAVERLVSLVGPAATKQLMYGAELVDAEWALRRGLVDEVVPTGDLDDVVERLVATMLSRSGLTQHATKAMVDEAARTGMVQPSTVRTWDEHSRASGETSEGVAAFIEGRSPRFPWRRGR